MPHFRDCRGATKADLFPPVAKTRQKLQAARTRFKRRFGGDGFRLPARLWDTDTCIVSGLFSAGGPAFRTGLA
jgi:hypothetical protein